MAKSIKFWDLPEAVKAKVDGMEFVTGYEIDELDGKTIYRVLQGGSFEVWSKIYASDGRQLRETAFLPREQEA